VAHLLWVQRVGAYPQQAAGVGVEERQGGGVDADADRAPGQDLGFVGLDDDPQNPVVVTGYKATGKRKLTRGQKSANTVLSAARALVEHGFPSEELAHPGQTAH
jgi:hypothetical protein